MALKKLIVIADEGNVNTLYELVSENDDAVACYVTSDDTDVLEKQAELIATAIQLEQHKEQMLSEGFTPEEVNALCSPKPSGRLNGDLKDIRKFVGPVSYQCQGGRDVRFTTTDGTEYEFRVPVKKRGVVPRLPTVGTEIEVKGIPTHSKGSVTRIAGHGNKGVEWRKLG